MPEPIKPGDLTSEFRLTKAGIIIGAALQALALVVEVLPAVAPHAEWLPQVALICGVILQVGAIFGYQVSRGLAKGGQQLPPPPIAPSVFTASGPIAPITPSEGK